MHSFQNTILPKKKPKTAFLGWQKWTPLSLRGAGGQTVHNRSTFGVPLKTYGHNASNEVCGRSVASKFKRFYNIWDCVISWNRSNSTWAQMSFHYQIKSNQFKSNGKSPSHIMTLQHLHLGSNGLKSVAKSSEDFSPLTTLTSLDLSRNSIQVIVINIKICMMSIIVLIFSFPWPPCRQTTTKTLTQYFVPCTTCFDHMIMIITPTGQNTHTQRMMSMNR